jgi:predicted MFS family arabinose efflux permease
MRSMGVDADSKGLFTRVTLPLAVFGLINQAARTVLAIIGPVLAVEFALSASELGMLAACMLAAYAVAQLPGGMALDRVGARNVQAALSLVTAAGFALFALAESFAALVVARLILGVGISAGLMAIIKANAQWFAPAKVALVTGIAVSIGGLGSVLSTVPVAAALPALGWRGVLWVLCGVSAATAFWILLSVPHRGRRSKSDIRTELGVMGSILGSRVFWRFAPAVAMLSVLNFAYLGLWAGPWLRDVAGYDSRQSAHTLLAYTLSMMVGALVVGAATSRAKALGLPPMLVTLVCTAGQVVAQIGLMLQPAAPLVVGGLWILFAFCVAGATAGYITVGQMFPPEQTARVATAVNTLTLGGAFVLQAAVGWVLDFWPRTESGGWDPRGYSAALAVSLLLQVAIAGRLLGGRR